MIFTRTVLAILTVMIAAPATWAAETIDMNLGYSHVVRPAEVPGTVIVGDDAIADATIGGGNTVILTGKALGATNLIILDPTGREILSTSVTVAPVDRRPSATIRVVKGSNQGQEYRCEADSGCMPVATGSGNAAPSLVAGASPETVVESAAQPQQNAPEPEPEATAAPQGGTEAETE